MAGEAREYSIELFTRHVLYALTPDDALNAALEGEGRISVNAVVTLVPDPDEDGSEEAPST